MNKITDLLLLGTIHNDQQGHVRLKKILDWYKPEVISIECSSDMLEDAKFDQKVLDFNIASLYSKKFGLSSKQVESLAGYLNTYMYELRVAINYSLENTIPLVSAETKKARDEYIEKTKNDKFSMGLNTYNQQEIDESYSDILVDMVFSPSFNDQLFNRDIIMVENIKKLSGNVLHISGAAHIFNEGITLYDRLKDYSPKRTTLLAADTLDY